MRLPIAVSVPHAGLSVPDWLAPKYALSREQTIADGDVHAFEIYDLEGAVARFARTDVARAVLDMNRSSHDLDRADGVVKTHSCWQEPVWREPLCSLEVHRLLDEFHRPYHRELTSWAGQVEIGIDCHTMSDVGPPIGPDSGSRRPLVCLGDANGSSCPRSWSDAMLACLRRHFGDDVQRNEPFAGGFITRAHGTEMPWLQIELSRTDEVSVEDKRRGIEGALRDWCRLDLAPEDPTLRNGTPLA